MSRGKVFFPLPLCCYNLVKRVLFSAVKQMRSSASREMLHRLYPYDIMLEILQRSDRGASP